MQLLPHDFSLPAFWGQQRDQRHLWEPAASTPRPEAWEQEDPRLPEHLTSDRGGVQMDQWVICVLLWSHTWDAQASTGVLVIVTVVKLKGLSRVVLRP